MAKVLIVEDERLVAEAMSLFLDEAGHHVVGIAKDQLSALRQAAAEQPDVVLMDIRLAGSTDGVETAQKMQAERAVDVVFVTAHADPATRVRAAAVHPAAFVMKPFSSEQLLKAISAAEAHRKR